MNTPEVRDDMPRAGARAAAAPTAAAAQAQASRARRQAEVVAALSEALPRATILFRHEDTVAYECDALTAYRASPLVVAIPETEAQVVATLRICHRLGVPVIARGAGTGLSGGVTPHLEGVVLSLAKFNKILAIDPAACVAPTGAMVATPAAIALPRITSRRESFLVSCSDIRSIRF